MDTRTEAGRRFERALIVHGGALGDLILSLRLVEALRRSGARQVSLLARPTSARICIACGAIDDLRDIEAGGFHRLFGSEDELPSEAREWLGTHNIAINTLGDPEGVIAEKLRAAGVAHTISIDPRPREDLSDHVSDQWLSDLKVHGVNGHVGPPRLVVPVSLRAEAHQVLQAYREGVADRPILLHPGSGGRDKCWKTECFVELSEVLRRRGFLPIFVLGPVEMERLSADEIASLRAAAKTIENPTLELLAGLIAEAGLFVGNDSGVSHLAAAVGAKTLTLFGPTNPVIWRPLGENVRISQGGSPPRMPTVSEVLPHLDLFDSIQTGVPLQSVDQTESASHP